MKPLLFTFIACAVTLAAKAQAADDYEIKLSRPVKVGQKFSVSAKGKEVSVTTAEAEGNKLNNQRKELQVEYEAEVTVLAVGKNGRATKESHKVGRFVKISGDEKVSLLDKGTVVVASRPGKKTSFEIANADTTKELNEALALIIDINDGNSPNEDEIIGTNKRKKIGESWPVNQEMLEKAFAKDPSLQMQGTGEFMLKEVVKEATGEAVVVEGTIKGNASFPLPSGFNARNSTLTVAFSARFPVDTTLPRTQERSELNLILNADGKPNPDGPEVQLKMTSNRVVTRKLALIK